MRRAVVTTSATLAGVVLLLSLKTPESGGHLGAATKVISSAPSGASDASDTSGASGASPSASASASAPATATASRSITGTAADTRYGAVQVRVTLAGKKISRIDVLQYPTESHRDQEINTYALPQLNQEAMDAQSAQIDVVSGATYTSDGYTRSLQSALDQVGL
ncbi:FMN-binding protein [Kitasatospora sp. McL0602]|uniref:FMN-binding protein n=1 Tax=Kitasatospora sp. McL0602 TaxID=3439530 RepID=UPI003F8BA21F